MLVTNEIVADAKLARLATLAQRATVGVLADDAATVARIGHAARAAGVTLDVLVEVDVGAHRCGVAPGAPAAALAAAIAREGGLRLRGIHAYHGAAQHLRTPAERATAIGAAAMLAAQSKAAIEAAGLACPVVTGAGTGTWQLERDSRVWTELQPGSYVFMDADYQRNALAADQHAFEQSLYVVATVMSAVAPDRAVVDAGLKAFAFDSGPPQVYAARGLEYVKASDEHGVIAVSGNLAATGAAPPRVGDRLWLVPGTATPRSTSTTGSSACAAPGSSRCGRSRRAARWAETSDPSAHPPARRAGADRKRASGPRGAARRAACASLDANQRLQAVLGARRQRQRVVHGIRRLDADHRRPLVVAEIGHRRGLGDPRIPDHRGA